MTNTEAIEILKGRYMSMSMCLSVDECKTENEALDLAIAALSRVKSLEDENAFLKAMQRDLIDGMDGETLGQMVRRNLT